tara:strand:- start:111 stop:1430 length:1320 start_codon:yes stop_codon:yes gene_type:complete
MASTYLQRTAGNSSNTTGTVSLWVKRSKLGVRQYILGNYNNAGNYGYFRFESNDRLYHYSKWDTDMYIETTRQFKDLNAWYHIVLAIDSTQSTASNRLKIYVNGVQETTLQGTDYGSQNTTNYLLQASASNGHRIGSQSTTSDHFDGLMSHFHFVDGTAYTPSTFGQTDAITGEWSINNSPTVTYGSQGYFMLKNDNSLSDDSGNGNNFTLGGGTLNKTEDCPSNVFATLNPLVKDAGSVSYTSGNNKQFVDTAGWRSSFSTLGASTGKYYYEVLKNAGTHTMVGIIGQEETDGSRSGNGNNHVGQSPQGYALYNYDGYVKNNNNDVGSAIGTFADGDYIGIFMDLDNNKVYWSKNGTMLNTTGVSITAGLTYMFGISGHTSARLSCNFGNGLFDNNQLTGTTYNGSDGNGIFKYNPNNITLDGSSKSFKSLSTKGLNS